MRVCSLAVLVSFSFLASIGHAANYRLLSLDGAYVKWGARTFGKGAEVTYSFAQQKRRYPGAINCGILGPIPAYLGTARVGKREIMDEFRAAFRMWEAAANISFQYVADPVAADIVIGIQGNPRGIAYANVWHGEAADTGMARITKATICLNPSASWEVDFDGRRDTYSIRQVAAHEIGHAIGLDHPGRSGQLMGYRYSELTAGLRFGDAQGAVMLYGESRRDGPVAATPPAPE